MHRLNQREMQRQSADVQTNKPFFKKQLFEVDDYKKGSNVSAINLMGYFYQKIAKNMKKETTAASCFISNTQFSDDVAGLNLQIYIKTAT